MLTYKTTAAGSRVRAGAVVDHLLEQTLPVDEHQLADYYQRGMAAGIYDSTAAAVRQDTHAALAAALKLDLHRSPTREELVNLTMGLTTEGEPIHGKQMFQSTEKRERLSGVDLTFSSDKTIGIQWALEKTAAGRAAISGAVMRGGQRAMEYAEALIGKARMGHAGQDGAEPGHITWVAFHHYTSRPTVALVRTDDHGERFTDKVSVKVAGDMNQHIHFWVPNAVFTDSGRTVSFDLSQLRRKVKEVGAYFQIKVAEELRLLGIDAGLDPKTGSAVIRGTPEPLRKHFSKRTRDGDRAARQWAKDHGANWDALSDEDRWRLLKRGTKAERKAKTDDVAKFGEWRQQAADLGYADLPTPFRDLPPALPLPEHEARRVAYEAALPFLASSLSRRSVVDVADAREAAARGLIATGAKHWSEIDVITDAMREAGVMQDGERTALKWGRVFDETGEEIVRITTAKHLAEEEELVGLIRAAGADRSAALSREAVDRAIEATGVRFEASERDPTGEHATAQREMLYRLAGSGRWAAGIGAHGSGKSTLAKPLVWAFRDAGREVYVSALNWRQTDDLADDLGVDRRHRFAMTPLLQQIATGEIVLTDKSDVLIDEMSVIGRSMRLELARIRAATGARIIELGDPEQCQSIDAIGVELVREGLGDDAIPQIFTTIRQATAQERETSLMFRDGHIREGLDRKLANGTAEAVLGSYEAVLARAADVWEERRRLRNQVSGRRYDVTVLAPSNEEAADMARVLRERRRAAGEIIGTDRRVEAISGDRQHEYDLTLAAGDRVRLYRRVNASFGEGRYGNIGSNGSVVEIREINDSGLRLRTVDGLEGWAKWSWVTDKLSGRVQLAYGDVMTIHSGQGVTSGDNILVTPRGSQSVDGHTFYSAAGRHVDWFAYITSDLAERSEIEDRQPLNDPRPIRSATVWDNVVRNIERKPVKMTAVELQRSARAVAEGAAAGMSRWFQPIQRRTAEGQSATVLRARFQRGRELRDVLDAMKAAEIILRRAREAGVLMKRRTEMAAAATQEHVMAVMGKLVFEGKLSTAEALDAIVEARVRPSKQSDKAIESLGRLVASGLMSYAQARDTLTASSSDDDRSRLLSDAVLRCTEVAAQAGPVLSHAVRRAAAAAGAHRRAQEDDAAAEARRLWHAASRATRHPSMEAVGLRPRAARVDSRGDLLLPVRDAKGSVHNVQRVGWRGETTMLKHGRVDGVFSTTGKIEPRRGILIARTYQDAVAIHDATDLAVVVAFTNQNLKAVAKTLRQAHPNARIVLAAERTQPGRRDDAREAANAAGGVVVQPDFQPGEAGDGWMDYGKAHGRDAIRKILLLEMETNVSNQTPKQAARDAARAQARRAEQTPTSQKAAAAEQVRRQAEQQAERSRQQTKE